MKHDRAERVVIAAGIYSDLTGPYTITLLRREQAWMRRMVKKIRSRCDNVCGCCCDDILAQLEKRRT